MTESKDSKDIRDWWKTSIINMEPGKIEFRGMPIQDLMGSVTFVEMICLMVLGQLPSKEESKLLEAALVAGVDHGPQAPSIAAARMAVTCGLGLNNVIATGVNMLGDVHGGAGEQCAELYYDIEIRLKENKDLEKAVTEGLSSYQSIHGKIIPGFGHRFHKTIEPRASKLISLVQEAARNNIVSGKFSQIAIEIQKQLSAKKEIVMNIDGATSIIFCELGFPAPLSRGLFCLSRSVGILAHAWEQMEQGGRNKGPMPPRFLPSYEPKELNKRDSL